VRVDSEPVTPPPAPAEGDVPPPALGASGIGSKRVRIKFRSDIEYI